MLQIYEILVIIISIIIALYSVKKTTKYNKTIYIIYLIFWAICVLPLVCDYIIGSPEYKMRFYGFAISHDDYETRFFYATYILVSQFIMLIAGNNRFKVKTYNILNNNTENKKGYLPDYKLSNIMEWILCIASLSTVILVIILPISKEILWEFGWRDSDKVIQGLKYYSTVERISYISIASGIICIFNKKYKNITKIAFLIVLYMTICVESKRSIIFFVGILIISYLIYNTDLKKRKYIYILGIVLAVSAIFYSVYVKTTFRGYDDANSLYTTMRIDFGRDDTVKLVIYSLLNSNEMKILQYPGQSVISQIGSIFPLQFIGIKSIGYNAFLTAALIGQSVNPSVKWMTTSIFDETIANFGIFGFWIAPIILALFARIADKQSKKLLPITIGAVTLVLMYPINYIMWFLQFWSIIVIVDITNYKRQQEN